MASELAQDGTVIWFTLAEPGLGFARAVSRGRVLTVLVLATALSLLSAGLILPTLDSQAVASASLQGDMTPHEREEAIATALKLHQVKTWGAAAVLPATSALLLAVALWLGFRVAGARTGFKVTFAVAAHALLPQALRAVLTAPAAMVHAPLGPDDVPGLLHSSLASLLPATVSLPGPALAALGALDLFTLWTLALAAWGMGQASGASRLRTGLVMLVLFAAWVALFKVVPSAGGS